MRRALGLAERGRGQHQPQSDGRRDRRRCRRGDRRRRASRARGHAARGGPRARCRRRAGPRRDALLHARTVLPHRPDRSLRGTRSSRPASRAWSRPSPIRIRSSRAVASRYLRERGVDVDVGVAAAEAARLNAPFFTFIRTGRPFVTAKAGVSLDGRIAARRGERTAITGAASCARRSPAARGGRRDRGRLGHRARRRSRG